MHAILPPLAVAGPTLTIRRFSAEVMTVEQLLARGSMTDAQASILVEAVRARRSIIVSGGAGAGKTTLLGALASHIDPAERVITIEDAAELRLQREHVVSLETRPANVEGRGRVTVRDLVRNALRMRPDRIIVGEVRGAEVLDMLQAMNTGHDGSMTTVHANAPRDALTRLEHMVGMTGIEIPEKSLRAQVASAMNVIIQAQRLSDGRRRVVSVQ